MANRQQRASNTWLWFWFLLAPAASFCVATNADELPAAELYVIANPGVELSTNDIRDVYLGEKLLAGNVKLVPVDNSEAQAQFLAKVMLLDRAKYESIWIKKGFRDGLQAPSSKPTDTEVIAYVRRVPGAVGYVSKMILTPSSMGVRVIKRY